MSVILPVENTSSVFLPMKNTIQHYPWGSTSALNQLFNIENETGEPQAEVWMGAHPNGCSRVVVDGLEKPLSSVIGSNLNSYLSDRVASHFGELPYLFKVLSAEKALSIQVHPSKQKAQLGYELEEQKGIPIAAGHRNYKDPNHKPELVYALTQYTAMNGFRSISEILSLFTELNNPHICDLVEEFSNRPDSNGLQAFFLGLLTLSGATKESAIQHLFDYANSYLLCEQPQSSIDARTNKSDLYQLIKALFEQYPGDIGLFSPLILNVITLEPGQAMYLDAETPHAYLKGTGLEIMANSDNVLRAGLTGKFLDVHELIACTQFIEKPFDSLVLEPSSHDGMLTYPIPVEDFRFSILTGSHNRCVETEGAEILLPIDEPMTLTHANGEVCTINKGQSVFIPAYTGQYYVSCLGRVARAHS